MAVRRTGLVRARKAAGFTQETFAEAAGVDRSAVARWETGVREPSPHLRWKLAKLLRVSLDRLDELITEGAPDRGAPSERLAHVLLHPTSADLVAVAELRQQVYELDERYDRAPSTSLLAETGQTLGRITFLSAHATHRVRRELSAVEAQCAILMGQLVWDASQRRDHRTAHMYFDQAGAAAKRVRDSATEGLALLRKSYVALYGQKDPRTGLSLTTRAADVTAQTSQVLSGLATLHAAEAHAMMGRQADCEAALTEAGSHFDRIDDDDAALGLFSPTQQGRLAGSCYLFLGEPRRAEHILEATSAQLRNRSKSEAILLGNLSLARLRQGKVDEAAGALHQAMDVIELTWGGGGLNILFDACREMQPWRQQPEVQDVYDRMMSLMATR
ncbi:helix-turn-helix domain-containing protein [Saccharothrix obliqua]|uniref:helix-turn-helix domain-containing protein n=1 Tax=Saccharothrix obliqua TaxID=2861747 RepID=UPI001C5F3C91|nr:helix-turn-helix transcriptional regulator [Saccharothrix obliqua]MBW4720718.1 helix-turn-helix domain-containing protein [Saccharothrix obliqua]